VPLFNWGSLHAVPFLKYPQFWAPHLPRTASSSTPFQPVNPRGAAGTEQAEVFLAGETGITQVIDTRDPDPVQKEPAEHWDWVTVRIKADRRWELCCEEGW
jgi:hypothetical protein